MKALSVALFCTLALLVVSCKSSDVQSGKAIYCPGVQLEKVSATGVNSDMEWQAVSGSDVYASITNLQNGKKARTQILMRRVTETGAVIVSVNKDAAKALGIVNTGLAPVEIRYTKRVL